MDSAKKPEQGTLIGLLTKTTAVRKFMRATKQSPSPSTSSSALLDATVVSKASVTGQSSMDTLSLKEKRDSQMRREMSIKHVRIQTPLQQHIDYYVQRERADSKIKRKRVGVLKPADPDACSILKRAPGPKYGVYGQILPHSILGDVGSFLMEARKREQFQQMTHCQDLVPKKCNAVAPIKESSTLVWHTVLNEERALVNWELEMFYRRLEQRRLADTLNRPVKNLLMTRTDYFRRQHAENSLSKEAEEQFHPDVSFWTLEPRYGSQQIMTTLTKTEQGCMRTPVRYGDGARIVKEKGQSDIYKPSSWNESDCLKNRLEQSDGVIHITNNELFRELEVLGQAIIPPKQSNSLTDALTNTLQSENHQDKSSFEDKNFNKAKILGPSLCIDGTTLGWHWNGETQVESGKERIAKEAFVLLEAKVGEIVKSHMTFENNGTIVLKYLWKKEPVFHPLPIRRPVRRPFYCYDDAGSIRPGEIIHVPVLFRSRIPGYFSESWLLDTIPVLENGAKIRFTLKGVAREVTDLTRQCLEIEEYLRRKQIETLCRLEAQFIVDSAIVKASYDSEREVDEPIYLTKESMFEEINPGFYYHEHIIKDLWILFDAVSKDTNVNMTEGEAETSVLHISNLRKMIVNLPCPAVKEADDHYQMTNDLFNAFCRNVMDLSFSPLIPLHSEAQLKHVTMYTLLQHGLEEFTHCTHKVAETLGMVVEEAVDITPLEVKQKKMRSGSHKPKAKITASSKGKIKDSKEASPTHESPLIPVTNCLEEPDPVPQFSPVTKYKQTHGPCSANLDRYEEKTYIMMYEMLTNTMDSFYGLFC